MIDRLDLHTHTLASGHAYGTLTEMARAAADAGLEALGITEHAPAMEGSCSWLYFANMRVLPREMYGVRLLYGAELNILDFQGHVDLDSNQMKDLDYAIASIHSVVLQSGTAEENTDAYIAAMDVPEVKIIGHPDDDRAPVDYERLVRAAREKRVLLEVNDSSMRPASFRKNACENLTHMLELCKKLDVSVVVNSDAHFMDMVGEHTRARALLESVQFPEELVINTSLEKFLSFIHWK